MNIHNICLSILSLQTIRNCTTLLDDFCVAPTTVPSSLPSIHPSFIPTPLPSEVPTFYPSGTPSYEPSMIPTFVPSVLPTEYFTYEPTNGPTPYPSFTPTNGPTPYPSFTPTNGPTPYPSITPTNVVLESNNKKEETLSREETDIIISASVLGPIFISLSIYIMIKLFNRKKKNKFRNNISRHHEDML